MRSKLILNQFRRGDGRSGGEGDTRAEKYVHELISGDNVGLAAAWRIGWQIGRATPIQMTGDKIQQIFLGRED